MPTQKMCKQIFYIIHNSQNLEANQMSISHGRIQNLCYNNTVNTTQQQKWNKVLIPPTT